MTMKPEKRRQLCGSKMAMVFQEPMTSLNPVLKIERQVGESLRIHTKLGNAEIHERVVQALSKSVCRTRRGCAVNTRMNFPAACASV